MGAGETMTIDGDDIRQEVGVQEQDTVRTKRISAAVGLEKYLVFLGVDADEAKGYAEMVVVAAGHWAERRGRV